MPEEYSIYRASMNLMCTQWEDGSQWEPLQGRNRSGRRAWWRKPLIILLVLTVMKIILYDFVFLSGGTNGNSYSYMHILIPFALYIIPGSLIPIMILPKILSRHLTIAFGYAGFISGTIMAALEHHKKVRKLTETNIAKKADRVYTVSSFTDHDLTIFVQLSLSKKRQLIWIRWWLPHKTTVNFIHLFIFSDRFIANKMVMRVKIHQISCCKERGSVCGNMLVGSW